MKELFRSLANSFRGTAALSATIFTAVVLSACLAGCGESPQVRSFAADAYPDRLSEWGILRRAGGQLQLAQGVEPFDINTPLFSDYAEKLRTVWLPPGTSAVYDNDGAFEFPVGTIISKTFFYANALEPGVVTTGYSWQTPRDSLPTGNLRVLETRLLVRQADGWDALPYVWRGDDAYLKIAGDLQMLQIDLPTGEVAKFPYVVPTRNECAACHATNHTTGKLEPIGLRARHLNRGYRGAPVNQLLEWQAAGRLQSLPDTIAAVPANADVLNDQAPLEAKARAYLDTNCGHCHNEQGAADTSGLILDVATASMRQLGVCKAPIAAGQGTGGHAYSIVPGKPEASILIYRLETIDPGSRMPELGRSLVHTEGVALLRSWVAALEGECVEITGD